MLIVCDWWLLVGEKYLKWFNFESLCQWRNLSGLDWGIVNLFLWWIDIHLFDFSYSFPCSHLSISLWCFFLYFYDLSLLMLYYLLHSWRDFFLILYLFMFLYYCFLFSFWNRHLLLHLFLFMLFVCLLAFIILCLDVGLVFNTDNIGTVLADDFERIGKTLKFLIVV